MQEFHHVVNKALFHLGGGRKGVAGKGDFFFLIDLKINVVFVALE